MPDLDTLPYAENGGFAPRWFRYAALGASALLAALKLTGVLATTWLVVAAPLLVIAGLFLLHRCIRNASHEAIRLADADDALDQMVMQNVGHNAKRTLTPMLFGKHLDETLP